VRIRHIWIALGASLALAACGGGGSSGSAAAPSNSSGVSSSSGTSSTSGSSTSGSSSGSSSTSSGSTSSSSGTSSSSSTSSSSGAAVSNQIAIVVNSGPAAASPNTFNIPYASVKVCVPNTNQCATISDLQVDTGSSGLRIFASVLSNAGITLTRTSDPANSANSIGECQAFLGGYLWGAIAAANVQMAGETASNLSVQVIDDTHGYATVPNGCTTLTSSTSLNTVKLLHANGILGIGVFSQDCGPECAQCGSLQNGCTGTNDFYYSCSGSGSCTPTPVALSAQVDNPITFFATDNNGSIIALPAVGAGGKSSATGTITFGIGTQSNNTLPTSASILTLDDQGLFTATFNNHQYDSSFIDSGSNAFYFTDSLTTCSSNAKFYCPNSTVSLSAINQGHAPNGLTIGSTSTVNFTIANLQTLLSNGGFAYENAGGAAQTSSGSNSLSDDFDFGLPFFYGRSIYTGIADHSAGSTVGPFVAY
jgi:uncharacterized protein DUF3443